MTTENGNGNGVRFVGVREYARLRGCTPSAVTRAIQSGRISVQRDARGRPRINPSAANDAWRSNTDPVRERYPVPPGVTVIRFGPLLDLLVRIEIAMSRCLSLSARHRPRAGSLAAWRELYDAWGRIPDVIEELQAEIRGERKP